MSITIPPRVPHGYAEIVDYYGDPKPQKNGSSEWTVDTKWERDFMVPFHHPILPTRPCPTCGAPQPGKLYVNRLIVESLGHCLDLWRARQLAGDPYRITHTACFAPRAQRGARGLIPSTHTWGIAWDTNEHTNPLISQCEPDDPRRAAGKDLPDPWIADMESVGAVSGYKFSTRSDPMHGQFCSGY